MKILNIALLLAISLECYWIWRLGKTEADYRQSLTEIAKQAQEQNRNNEQPRSVGGRPPGKSTVGTVASPAATSEKVEARSGIGASSAEEAKVAIALFNLRKTEQYQKVEFEIEKGRIRTKYGRLLERLKLSATEEEQFLTLLNNREHVSGDAGEAVGQMVQTLAIGEAEKLTALSVADAHRQIDGQLKQLLGEPGMALLEDYQANIDTELLLGDIEQQFAVGGVNGMTPAQVADVAEILKSIPPARQSTSLIPTPLGSPGAIYVDGVSFTTIAGGGAHVSPAGEIYSNQLISDSALELLAKVLTPEQMRQMNAFRDTQQARLHMAQSFNFK